jgi:hypothetical protein
MGKYAEKTEVTQEGSRAEIEATLHRYGADAFSYGWELGRAVIAFRAQDRHVRFEITMPDRNAEQFTKVAVGANQHTKGTTLADRNPDVAFKLWDQACRQRWRALALVVKAKLEAVESGISEFEEEFLSHIVLPDGSTVGQQVRPHIEKAYLAGKMPKFLLLPPGEDDR